MFSAALLLFYAIPTCWVSKDNSLGLIWTPEELRRCSCAAAKSPAKVIAGQSRRPKSPTKVAAKVAGQSLRPKSQSHGQSCRQSRQPKSPAEVAGQSRRPKSRAKVAGQCRGPCDEVTQSVQRPIFWSDAAIQYLKVQGTKVLVAHFSNYSLTLCNL